MHGLYGRGGHPAGPPGRHIEIALVGMWRGCLRLVQAQENGVETSGLKNPPFGK